MTLLEYLEQQRTNGDLAELNINPVTKWEPPKDKWSDKEGTFAYAEAVESCRTCDGGKVTYQWLDYKLRAVTAVKADDQVLSGPFSGCFLVVFKKPDNLTYVAHIGTGGSEVTAAVKKTWTEFAGDPKAPPTLLAAFNPARAYFGVSLIPPTKPKELKKHQASVDKGFADLGELAKKGATGPEVQDVGSVIYAVVTPKPAVPECHTVLLRQQKRGPLTVPLFRVIGIFPSIPVADLAKNPLFK